MPPAGVSREEIEDYLLDRVLPAAYAPRPGRTPPRYGLQAARLALGNIAARMSQDGTRDLAWWRIPGVGVSYSSRHRDRVVFGLMFALGGGPVFGPVLGRCRARGCGYFYLVGAQGQVPGAHSAAAVAPTVQPLVAR